MQFALEINPNETSMDSLKNAVKKNMQKFFRKHLWYRFGRKSVNNTVCRLFLVLRGSELTELKSCIPIVPPYIVVCNNLISKKQVETTTVAVQYRSTVQQYSTASLTTTAATENSQKQLNILLIIIGSTLVGVILIALVCYCSWDFIKVSIEIYYSTKFYYKQYNILTILYVNFNISLFHRLFYLHVVLF